MIEFLVAGIIAVIVFITINRRGATNAKQDNKTCERPHPAENIEIGNSTGGNLKQIGKLWLGVVVATIMVSVIGMNSDSDPAGNAMTAGVIVVCIWVASIVFTGIQVTRHFVRRRKNSA